MRLLQQPLFALLAPLLALPLVAQHPGAAARGRTAHSSTRPQKSVSDVPLSPRERALQMLNRFTFGPRPGDVEQVLGMGLGSWFEQQLEPGSISDTNLEHRLSAYPTLNLSPDQALQLFPNRGAVQQVAEGKHPYPADPQLAAMYEVQVLKYNRDLDAKKIGADGKPAFPQPTETDLAAQKKTDQATAATIAGDLFALPRQERMATLLRLPVADRIAFASYVSGDQKKLLLGEFTPREREIFEGMASGVGASNQIVAELAQAKMLRAILSERQVQEVMTDFWFNHFNVYVGKDSDQWYTTSYERDAIRKHALGKFRDLLLATATSPAMMIYLDNWESVGPDSIANGVNPSNPKAKRGNKGLNENYGREVMELHTLSVDGGYTQADVTALASILTGWTVDRPNQGGPFLFDPKRHEPGSKQWLGRTIAEGRDSTGTASGMREGMEALTLLAASPKTAHFISYLLAQRFVADEPPPALVDRLAAVYTASDGNIREILRALVSSPEFNSRLYFRTKVKTPMEFLASAFRSTATDPSNPGALVGAMKNMGMPLFYALPPTGYLITADQWLNTGALVDRLNFAYQLTQGKFANQKFDAPRVLALGLMAEPAGSEPVTSIASRAPEHRSAHPAVLVSGPGSSTDGSTPTVSVGGPALVLHILSTTLVGEDASPRSAQLIREQIAGMPQASSADSLNLMTALILGSPDFQKR